MSQIILKDAQGVSILCEGRDTTTNVLKTTITDAAIDNMRWSTDGGQTPIAVNSGNLVHVGGGIYAVAVPNSAFTVANSNITVTGEDSTNTGYIFGQAHVMDVVTLQEISDEIANNVVDDIAKASTVVDGTVTEAQFKRIVLAALCGRMTVPGPSTAGNVVVNDPTNAKTRVTVQVDGDGNRELVTFGDLT